MRTATVSIAKSVPANFIPDFPVSELCRSLQDRTARLDPRRYRQYTCRGASVSTRISNTYAHERSELQRNRGCNGSCISEDHLDLRQARSRSSVCRVAAVAGEHAMNARELERRLENYLAVRSALGYRDYALRNLLRDFVRCLVANNRNGPIRAGTAVDWACATSGRNGASRLAYRLSAARGFLIHLRASVPDTEVPGTGLLKKSPRRIPYLFSNDQIRDLLRAAATIGPAGSLRPHTYETILGLMASTGIRVGEAIRLTTGDVKLGPHAPRLEIRESKFKKSRIVPLHPTTAEKLRDYVSLRTRIGYGSVETVFFPSERRKPLCYETLRSWFARTTRELGMCPSDDRRKPTLHGLRHHFAVERLTLWCQQGAPVGKLAPNLSVYLGHMSPEESYWYLTSTPELLMTAGKSFQRFAVPGGTL